MNDAPGTCLVEPDWLESRLADPTVKIVEIQWTSPQSYEEGHIPGARGWAWKDWLWDPLARDFPTPQEFAQRCAAAGIGNADTVVFYSEQVQFGCYGWFVFTLLGHGDARLLNGSKRRWLAEGRSLTTELPEITPASYTPPAAQRSDMRVRRDEMLTLLPAFGAGTEAVLLDHRTPEEFRGERVNTTGQPDHGAERAGRIPGARHLYYEELLADDHSFRSPEELTAILAARGATPDKQIVSYCRLSHRASLAYFVMTRLLGWKRVRSYDGSWTEWGSMVGVPIEK
ncbi:MAG: sulfurtransferase [Rhodospirillales bacterium]|nr:MAG: sulfurtransferase [Rhodospirillales bacterium]